MRGNDRLTARPIAPAPPATAAAGAGGETAPGLQTLHLPGARDGLLYVPATYDPGRPVPLVVMLHGAGGDARAGLDPFLRLADAHGLVLVAPASRGPTWDALLGDYGFDLATVDRALAQAFSRFRVDPSRLAVEGFSDGASYALSVGLANGDLFTHAIAFSPGFVAPHTPRGRPRLFVTHGTRDKVLPITSTSRRIVQRTRQDGYDVRYHELDGGHAVPGDLAEEAVRWFLATPR
jgi:predicted esterase